MEIKTYSDLEVLAYELCDIQFPKEATIHLSDTDLLKDIEDHMNMFTNESGKVVSSVQCEILSITFMVTKTKEL